MTPRLIMAIVSRSTKRYCAGSRRRYERYNRSLVSMIEDLMDQSFFMDFKTPKCGDIFFRP
jgi:hypothetical protein